MAFYDKDKIKETLSIQDVFEFVEYLGGEPQMVGDDIVMKTICHNGSHEGSEKLYYYNNTKLFNCYTGCGSMDIFELLTRVKAIDENQNLTFYQAMDFVAKFFKLEGVEGDITAYNKVGESDSDILSEYKVLLAEKENLSVTYNIYDRRILDNLSFVIPSNWVQEGIDIEVMKKYDIKYYGTEHKIVIPHYNLQGDLIGIRGRAMIELDAELYGKYMPLKIAGTMYNHPLSQNLYGLNFNLENIRKAKKIILFEGEKSVLHYESMFGAENNIAVATCGSSLSIIQEEIIKKFCDVEEVIIGYDKEFQVIGDKEFQSNILFLQKMAERMKNYCTVSILFDKDKENPKLDYKDAPVDKGKEAFEWLFENRIIL